MANIKLSKQPKPKMPKAITVADVVRLMDACGDDRLGIRNKAIIAFLADTGCRAAGLCGLLMHDLDVKQGRAYVVEKGGKRRAVWFGETTAYLLMQWLELRDLDAPTVFHNVRGHNLTIWGLEQLFQKLKLKAGVTGRANPHAFRHGFAREYLRNGGDLATLSRLMGHEGVEVTANFYGIFAEDELKAQHQAHSSLLKIKPVPLSTDSEEK